VLTDRYEALQSKMSATQHSTEILRK